MKIEYRGIFSPKIEIELGGDIIERISFTGGGNGNLQGLSRMLAGMKVSDVIERLKGVRCGIVLLHVSASCAPNCSELL